MKRHHQLSGLARQVNQGYSPDIFDEVSSLSSKSKVRVDDVSSPPCLCSTVRYTQCVTVRYTVCVVRYTVCYSKIYSVIQ